MAVGSVGRGLVVVALAACALLLLASQTRTLHSCPETTLRPAAQANATATLSARLAPAPPAPARDALPVFNWDELVEWRLAPWDRHWQDARVRRLDLDDLEELCELGTGLIFCTRIQIVNRRLFFKDVRALELDRDYAVSRIAPFIDLIRQDPAMPDLDLFLALNDQPSVPHAFRGARGALADVGRPPPMFGATMAPRRADIPWPDYSFWLPTRPHKTRTPPWDAIRQQVYDAGRASPWAGRSDLAFFAGDTRHPVRKEMLDVARQPEHAELFAIRTVWIHRAAKTCAEAPELDDGGPGIREPGCRYAPPDYCRYKYILNLGSGGSYANKFKYSLLCRSLLIHVSRGNSNLEFWQSQLVPGVHFMQVPTAQDVPALLRRLRSDPAAEAHARRIGEAGAERMGALTINEVATYCTKLLHGYAKRLAFKPAPIEGAVEVNCVDDLWRHYDKDERAPWFLKMLTHDNASCIRPPQPPFVAPGYGGAYRGSRVTCHAANNGELRKARCSPPANSTAERLAYLRRCYEDHCAEPCRFGADGTLPPRRAPT
ncbi:hypothetical protein KFE25_010428 [Diacronema lutheri]|uniref:Glycosyl transferase CAP10 domain-containing protein n=1 Tax=Diacronema lutheri TaxID=2081491 RepID=A0A8J5XA03_DIALT|nr:hypothetical protein KFE25_010428 [Diacronema lutheri]